MKFFIYLANFIAFAILGLINYKTQTVANEATFAITWIFMCLTIAEWIDMRRKTNQEDGSLVTE
jgi:hypothetical protein